MAVRTVKPQLDTKIARWSQVFNQVLDEMIRASKQPNDSLTRMDLVATAAAVAASLMSGTEF